MIAKIGIVDDHPLIRRGLAAAVQDTDDLHVAWTASSINETLSQMRDRVAQVLVVDLCIGNASGLDLVRNVKECWPDTRCLVSTMQDESLYAVRAFKAGASGFISKSDSVERLIDGIRSIAHGGVQFSPAVTAKLLDSKHSQAYDEKEDDVVATLSDRELQVFELMGEGYSTRAIAEALFVSPKTIDTFRVRIKRKLRLENSCQLTHFATKWVLESEHSAASKMLADSPSI